MADVSSVQNQGDIIAATSGLALNATATATLTGAAGKTTYIDGFTVSASSSTSGNVVDLTVSGLATASGGTLHYVINIGTAAGSTNGEPTPITVIFPKSLPASGQNVAIVVSMPAAGGGNNGGCAINAYGFRV